MSPLSGQHTPPQTNANIRPRQRDEPQQDDTNTMGSPMQMNSIINDIPMYEYMELSTPANTNAFHSPMNIWT